MDRVTIVKIGGNVIDNPALLEQFIRDFNSVSGAKILVHGGGKLASGLSERLNVQVKMIDGRRVTDSDTLDIVTMVYAGLVNKRIVAALQSVGCNAIGLSGADGNVVCAKRRSAIPIDYGFVGDIDKVNTDMLMNILNMGLVPVFSAIMHDGAGCLLNCNADSVAQSLACAVSAVVPTDLVYCFDKRGVLSDATDEMSVIPHITAATYPQLKESGVVSCGMIPKIENALKAIASGVVSVRIKHASDLSDEKAGTVIE